MDLGALLSGAQTLLTVLQSSELKDLCSIWGYQSELESLKCTINTIKAALLDADSMPELGHQAQLWVYELKNVIYDADDLLDQFLTQNLQNNGNLSGKVHLLFSRFNSVISGYKASRGVKKIRAKLDAIVSNHNRFGFKFDHLGFKFDYQSIRTGREETYSYVNLQHVIGRDVDKENIIGMLLDSNVEQCVSFLSVVGIGGLGKTTLTQLVYNDARIEQQFPMRLWVCVSDEQCWDLKAVVLKILESATCRKHEELSMDHLQRELREQLRGRRYLLVLDDVWIEDRHQWLKLVDLLMGGESGSWVLVTTRSKMTATVVGQFTYDLKGLSEEDSWLLFERTAFGQDYEQKIDPELVKIGQEIVKRCVNVPLAIRVVGTLLYGQDGTKWLSFREEGLGRIKHGETGIAPILRLSYNNLQPPVKICFSYCALLPKDFVIEKEMLISLWMAQGYVVPLDEGQSIEDAAEEYFLILLRRCFFQDVQKDANDEVISCKMHDLMHDIAQEVAGKEIVIADSIGSNLNHEIRHLFHRTGYETNMSFTSTRIRTYFQSRLFLNDQFVNNLVATWICLRALNLSYLQMKKLLSTLGNLLHLRYLDLSGNCDMERLPDSITKLVNLQTLSLEGCSLLKELPRDLSKLTKLRVLDTTNCRSLVHMPRGMGKLSCLRKLPFFVISERAFSKKWQLFVNIIEDIKELKNLKGNLCIWIYIPENAKYIMKGGLKGRCLSQHLNQICIEFPRVGSEESSAGVYDEALLEELQPHTNLRELKLHCYYGERLASWSREDNLATFLPNLVSITLTDCHRLQHVSSLGKLPKLRSLVFNGLSNVEYVENTTFNSSMYGVGALESKEALFPSLQQLTLKCLPKLKGWWREHSKAVQEHGLLLPSFPRVSYLQIMSCPNLESMPLCPNVEALEIGICNLKRQITSIESGKSKLRRVYTTNVGHLKLLLPMGDFQCLERMNISLDDKVESLSEAVELFLSCSSSLRHLKLWKCSQLKSLCGGLEHLTALQTLEIGDLPNLSLSGTAEGEDADGVPWGRLHQNLRSLVIEKLPNMEHLPMGICYLTALQSLQILDCRKLKSLPGSMQGLSSLKLLEIAGCSDSLIERCQEGSGEDWPKIQHIHHVAIHR